MEPLNDRPSGGTADDDMIWIEILSRSHDVVTRYRCSGPVVHIGRGYGNHIVIDDPHVAAHHLRITLGDDGRLVAEDLGSVNGLFVDGQTQSLPQVALDGGAPLRIGQTWLRVRTARHDVAPERPLARDSRIWPLALALISVHLGLSLLGCWVNETEQPQVSYYVTPLLISAAIALTWTGIWAIISRIFAGELRYARHLIVALSAALVMSLYTQGIELAAYALSLAALMRYAYTGIWLILAGLCFFHLRVISTRHRGLIAAIMLILAALGITGQTLSRHDDRAATGSATVVRRLQPPTLRLAPPQSRQHFFAGAGALKAELDHARTEEPPPSRPEAFSLDDDD